MRRSPFVFLLPFAIACNGDSTTPDSGSDASTDGKAPDSSSDGAIDSPSDGGDAGGPTCAATTQWGTPQLLPISTAQSDFFGSITPDELSIAWMTAAGTVLYADRTSTSMPFSAAQTITANVAFDRVSLTTDGLTLIVVINTRWALAQTTRSSRAAAFSATLDPAPYKQLDPPITEVDGGTGPQHGLFADPMLSPDGQFLYYSQYGNSRYTMIESYRATGDTSLWTMGRDLLEAAIEGPDLTGTRRRPTGISADNLTLFFYDMTTNAERMSFRSDPLIKNTYTTFVTLGATYENAMPTTACNRIYFSSPGSGGLDLFYADKL